jgi:predicted nucleic acid-binding Zn ribbon protein
MSEDPLKICPECGKEVRRLIRGGTGIIFKGSGFYITDKNAQAPKSESKGTDSPNSAQSSTESSSTGASLPSSGGSASAANGAAAPAANTAEKKPVKT